MSEQAETLDRVMVIAAHPDDPEFGCGGTIAKWADQGKEITFVLATSGDKGSHDPTMRPGQVAAMREAEQRAAAAELGVKEVIFLRHADGILQNDLRLRAQLASLIRIHKPDILLAIDPWRHYQLHPDHRAAGFAALDAVYAAREWNIFAEQLTTDEDPWRVSEIYLFWTDHPDHWEDVSDTIGKRIAALAQHKTQVGTDLEKLDERIRERCRKTAEQTEYEYAEALKKISFRR